MTDLDAADRALLAQLQAGLPVEARPFAGLAGALGLDEGDVLARLRRLRGQGIVRQIGPIFDARRLGYQSTLVAFHLAAADLERAAGQVSTHPGVSHNYGRAHHYNLWFTLAVPPGADLEAEIEALARRAGADDWLNLPAVRVFKLQTWFDLEGPGEQSHKAENRPRAATGRAEEGGDAAGRADEGGDSAGNVAWRGPGAGRPAGEVPDCDPARAEGGNPARADEGRAAAGRAEEDGVAAGLSPADVALLRVLQDDLPLVERPFAPAAARLGLAEDELLDRVRELQCAGIIRRLGAVLRHRRVGYRANGMACWAVPEAEIEPLGRAAAALPQVSHCYQRPAYPPRWPHSLFTMIHGRTQAEVEAVVAGLAAQFGRVPHDVLYSTREFKKERVRYFEVR